MWPTPARHQQLLPLKMTLAAELQRRITGRRVRVFERSVGHHQRRASRYSDAEDRFSTWITSDTSGGDRRGSDEADRPQSRDLFSGYIEVECGGGGAWLGMRVRLWTYSGGERCFRRGESVVAMVVAVDVQQCQCGAVWWRDHVALTHSLTYRCDALLCRAVKGVVWYEEIHRRHLVPQVTNVGEEEEEVTGVGIGQGTDAVVELLERVVGDMVARFRAANVQVGGVTNTNRS